MPVSRRILDVAVAVTALVLAGAPLVLACVLLRLAGTRSVIYRQTRVGRYGRPFHLLKLRTMAVSSGPGPAVTVAGDGRVTRVGRLLRRWKIDELPQLVNVLRGDLRIIGPRPEVPQFTAFYSDDQRRLLAYQPGLASMSQVVYPHEADLLRASADPERAYVQHLLPRKVAVDLAYEQRRTWRSDLGLVFDLLLLVAGWPRRMDTSLRIAEADPLLNASVAASRQP
jgi:lipopolysaccharide/colanic/teichoic acid biosynthesis glycosyltransferase